jgi:DNA-binding NarL/FixJ family response regulator
VTELRVLLVEDHAIFRTALARLLDAEPDLTVIGDVATGREAVRLCAELLPDVVVMDLNMTPDDIGGVQATREIVSTWPGVVVLVLTMHRDDDSLFAAMRAGARGYLLKNSGSEHVMSAIRAVAAGTAVFGPELAQRLVEFFAGRPASDARPFPQLTAREYEVLELIAQGEKNATIASALYISPKTVKNHVTNILAKLHLTDRSQAIIRARNAGL